MLVCGQHPARWSSGKVKSSACSREEGTLQRLGEKVSFLVCSADLGKSDMSCLDLLLKIFQLDVEMYYALLRIRPLSISWAECSVLISCGKVDYDKSG
jgi:hypothetical protein